jgi:hypothetical protein
MNSSPITILNTAPVVNATAFFTNVSVVLAPSMLVNACFNDTDGITGDSWNWICSPGYTCVNLSNSANGNT